MVRLKDIALRANVSVMTVSKVMRDASDISVATKLRIRQMADEMGYVPDSMAQSLRNRQTKLFGLVIPAASNPIFARVVMALEGQSHETGYDLLLGHTLNDPAREESAIRRMICRRIEGLFLAPVYRPEQTAPIYEELLRRKIPTVILGPKAGFCAPFANIEVDDLGASTEATRHLLRLGHRRIAFFTGPSSSPCNQERLEGYRQALREAGVPVEDSLIFSAGATIEEGEHAAGQLLKENPGATAIQAFNDLVAIGAANHLLAQGRSIPADFSIVGHGNVLVSEHYRVPLTTIAQPKYRLGEAAMKMMTQLLQGGAPETVRLPAELIERASTAPPQTAG